MSVDPSNPNSIPKFVDPLPIPSVIEPVDDIDGKPLFEVVMQQFPHRFHRDFPKTTVWGFNGTYPGPTFDVVRDRPIVVAYLNQLPTTPLVPIDTSVHGAESWRPAVRNVVHLHGGNVPSIFDGNPDAWFSPLLAETGPAFETNVYVYPNRQPAATLWYHDHAVGITRTNVYAGLAGFYLIRNHDDWQLGLPTGEFEIPLLIQDRSFNPDGSLAYPDTIQPEFFGDTIAVNGKLWPFLEVEPRRYRFRLVNGSNSRFYSLAFDRPLAIVQIGTDGGFLERPVVIPPGERLILAPAERADVIIDFTGTKGTTFTLTNKARTPFPRGDAPDPNTSVIMQFRVTLPLSSQDRSRIPRRLTEIGFLDPHQARAIRHLTLNERMVEHCGEERLIALLGIRDVDGRPLPATWGDSITEKPRLGTVEIWELINTTPDTHPIHVHLVQFQILDRQSFDVDALTERGELVLLGDPIPPDANERGLKDTVRANPGQVTRIIARFCDFPGVFPWHCHILEHEDHEMMRRYEVVACNAEKKRCDREQDDCGSDEDNCSAGKDDYSSAHEDKC